MDNHERVPRIGRRQFLIHGTMAGAGVLAASGAAVARPTAATLFTLGVASGDPTPNSVILWTRLAPDPLNGGGMPPLPVLVAWRLATDEGMGNIIQSGVATAWPSLAHSVHVDVRGLEPGRWYFYQFSVGAEASLIGRTRTTPAFTEPFPALSFGVVSCQDWQNGFYSAFRNLALEDLDLVVHLGDYIYEGPADPEAPRQHDGPELRSLQSYRNRHALYRTDPHLQAAHAACPWFVVPDDHEVDNDYAGANSEHDDDPAFLVRRANAYRAYYEHMPLRRVSFPTGPFMRLHRGLRWGTLAEFSALDTRQYRSDQPCFLPAGPRCAQALAESQTMTGPEQEMWLLERLDRSPARWNVIAQQTMFAQFDFSANPDRQLFSFDQWDGYVAARNRITRFLEARRPANPIVLTGDIHSSWVHNLKTDFDDPSSPVVGAEYIGPSITSDFLLVGIPFVKAALADNPHTVFFDGLFHGYMRCRVTPEVWWVDYRVVPTILDVEAPAFTLASFASLDGVPGASRV
jgi:alkaline phosphatase D